MNKRFRSRSLRAVIIAALVVASFSLGTAMDLINVDRDWWDNTVPTDSKVFVIQGMLSAYQAGWESGVTAEGSRFERESRAYSQAFQSAVRAISYRKLPNGDFAAYQHPASFSHTFGYYQSAVDDFYSVHTSESKLFIGNVLACLADTPEPVCSSYK